MVSREQVIQALQNPQEFKRIFNELVDIRYVGEKYSDQVHALVSYLMMHSDEFDRLVNDRSSLTYLVEQLPAISDALICYVIKRPQQFDRLIKTEFDFKACAKLSAFKKYANIFQEPSLAEARNTVLTMYSNEQILQAVRYLALGLMDEGSRLSVLPPELTLNIATHVREASVHSESYARSAANKQYNKYVLKK